jgi:serine/threonine protein phosphatase PrpC
LRILRASTATAAGPRHGVNQDRAAARATRVVLADGMGGRQAGDVAAQVAVDTVMSRSASHDLVAAVRAAHLAVHERAAADARLASMGTTVVALDLPDAEAPNALVVWVGDSRLLRLRGDDLWQVTHDHTWEAMLLDLGVDAATAAERRHILTRAVGTQDRVDPEMAMFEVEPGDRFLLCSDGVHGVLGADALRALLRTEGDPAAAIVAAAVRAGTHDDATAMVVDVAEVAAEGPPTQPIPVLAPV